MRKITKQDLDNWTDCHEEDIVRDGPFFELTSDQEKLFLDEINKRKDILDYFDIEEATDLWDVGVSHNSKECEDVLEIFYQFLLKIGVKVDEVDEEEADYESGGKYFKFVY